MPAAPTYPLSEVAEVRVGYSFRSRLRDDADGAVSVVQMKDTDILDGEVDGGNLLRTEASIKPHHFVQQGDLIFRSRGVSTTAVLVGDVPEQTIVAAPLYVIRSTELEPRYLRWVINHPRAQGELARHAEGTSVRMIGKSALEALEVPVPSRAVQDHVAAIADLAASEQKLMSEIALLRRQYVDSLVMNSIDS
ncbi:MAG: restriction endonuclease subunit [Thermoleophilia bacterium]|nr:restriction endonuclease subunit [Thermoleophilia bacterium]